MRIYFLLFSFILLIQTNKLIGKSDSLAIEKTIEEALQLKDQGNIVDCIEKIELAIKESQSAGLSEYFINHRLRFFLANRYSNIGDFDRAIELITKVELFYTQNNYLDYALEAKNNLGVYNQNIGRHELAYKYYYEGWLLQKESDEVVDKLDWLDGLSASCTELGKLEEAKTYLAEAETLLKICPPKDKGVLSLYYFVNKATHALAQKKEDKAQQFLLKCLEINKELGERKGADVLQLLANISLKQGENKQAISYAKQTLILLKVDQDSLAKDPYLLQAYSVQAKAYLKLKNYKEALINSKKAEEQAIFFQQEYMFNESKLFLGKFRRENLETAILALRELFEITNRKDYLKQALLYTDQAKSIVLNERWNNLKSLSQGSQKEAVKLRYKTVFQINKLKREDNNSQIIPLRNTLDSLNDVLYIKNTSSFSVDDLVIFQKSLTKEELYLTFLVVDSCIFRFDVRHDRIDWTKQSYHNPKNILDFYTLLKNPESTLEEIWKASLKLPNLLPSYLSEKSSIRNIHIIPDGTLNYLTFDAFPLNFKENYSTDINYAVSEYNFSYHFSLQSSQLNENKTSFKKYIGFAPDYSKKEKWADLKNSMRALELAKTHFAGDAYYGNRATKKNFQMVSPEADLLHLYTHGVSNDSSYNASYLVLQNEKIHVDEILALPLKASLCVLTACEAGLGKTYSGEGITGIAWSFKASGAENIIQSMWKLNEQSSSQLMIHFFNNLSNGHNSSFALTEAKRQYLASSEISDRLKHPYYWAGIGHYGYGAILAKKTNESLNWPLILGAIFLIGIFLIMGILSKKRSLK